MKWPLIGLIVVGLVAAFCVSLLVASFRTNGVGFNNSDDDSEQVELILAAKSLSAMAIIDSSCITTTSVPRKEAPEDYLSGAVQVIGKVLRVAVTEGQPFTKSCLIKEGSRPQLAAVLPAGMRAVSIGLSNRARLEGLLYPGCVVDVLASFKLSSTKKNKGEAISTTLLQGIQVIAIEDKTIVSKDEENEKDGLLGSKQQSGKLQVITLQVTPKQAEALQLAMEHGSITFSMRNPLDKAIMDTDATLLSEGRLAQFASLMAASVASEGVKTVVKDREPSLMESPAKSPPNQARADFEAPVWEVAIIRGSSIETKKLVLPEEDVDEVNRNQEQN